MACQRKTCGAAALPDRARGYVAFSAGWTPDNRKNTLYRGADLKEAASALAGRIAENRMVDEVLFIEDRTAGA